jgi:phospholipid/cholesterol/gamma-HCH transport system substrate-binding protein
MAHFRELKVGAFVLAGLALFALVVFLIGEERQLFERKQSYRTTFQNVEGLRPGSSVRMGGINVGTVSRVSYSENAGDPTIYVTLLVVQEQATRIRADSTATIENKGLLGDKMVVVTVGSQTVPQVPPGGLISSRQGEDVGEALRRLTRVTDKVENVVLNVERTTGALADDELHRDIKNAAASLSGILKSVDEGDGYAARLLNDPKEAERLSRAVASLEQASAHFGRTAQGLAAIVERVQRGPGFAHELIYGEGPSHALGQVGEAADEVRLTLRGVRESDSIAHGLLYGGAGSDGLVQNLNSVSADLRHIVADVRAGRGTLGALLVDPSLYEDAKALVGNVGRNKALRALVRYSIQRDEGAGGTATPAPSADPSGSPLLPSR